VLSNNINDSKAVGVAGGQKGWQYKER